MTVDPVFALLLFVLGTTLGYLADELFGLNQLVSGLFARLNGDLD